VLLMLAIEKKTGCGDIKKKGEGASLTDKPVMPVLRSPMMMTKAYLSRAFYAFSILHKALWVLQALSDTTLLLSLYDNSGLHTNHRKKLQSSVSTSPRHF